ncbi:MAG: amidohydrolase [Deltaproteobacteria bacterium]|nr:amidohydrolase [Candidatus Zymogenaceae bacterium]
MPPIIDAHIHIMPHSRIGGLMRWIRKAFPDHPVDPAIDEAGILSDLSDQEIRFFFNYVYPLKPEETDGLNAFNEELARRLPHSAPFGSLHLNTADKRAVTRRCIQEHRFVGLKFHPFVQRFNPADERMFVVYELMEEYERPVVLHTGFEDFYRMKMPPADIERILRRFPRLVLVLSHCLFPHFREVRALMEEYEGIWLDATNVFGALKYLELLEGPTKDHAWAQIGTLFRDLVSDFSKRTLFGSDHPVGMGTLDTIYGDLFAFGLPDEVSRAILWKNPLAFIGRFAPEISRRWNAEIQDDAP